MKTKTIIILILVAIASGLGVYLFIRHRKALAAAAVAMPDVLPVKTTTGYDTLLDMVNNTPPPKTTSRLMDSFAKQQYLIAAPLSVQVQGPYVPPVVNGGGVAAAAPPTSGGGGFQ